MNRDGLKQWRKRWGLTQEQLALSLGVTRVTVARWECGMVKIPAMLAWVLTGMEKFFQEGTNGIAC